jgi:hypothetical protein
MKDREPLLKRSEFSLKSPKPPLKDHEPSLKDRELSLKNPKPSLKDRERLVRPLYRVP